MFLTGFLNILMLLHCVLVVTLAVFIHSYLCWKSRKPKQSSGEGEIVVDYCSDFMVFMLLHATSKPLCEFQWICCWCCKLHWCFCIRSSSVKMYVIQCSQSVVAECHLCGPPYFSLSVNTSCISLLFSKYCVIAAVQSTYTFTFWYEFVVKWILSELL